MWSKTTACGQLPSWRQPVRCAGYGGKRLGMDPQPVGYGYLQSRSYDYPYAPRNPRREHLDAPRNVY